MAEVPEARRAAPADRDRSERELDRGGAAW